MYTLETISTAPSYEALKRNGMTDENIVEYYSLPNGQRGAFFNTFKNPIDIQIPQPPKVGTQKCTDKVMLYREVDAKLRALMQTDFVVNGQTFNMLDLGYEWKWNNNKSRFGVHKAKWRSNILGQKIFTLKRIELSRYMLEHTEKSLEDWVDTILHEIAHGIDFTIRGYSNHDWQWEAVAKAIGCSGEVCGNFEIKAKKKYEAICSCGIKYTRHRLVYQIRNGSCGRCDTPLQWKQNF